MSFEGLATFEVDLSLKTCRIWPDSDATPDTMRHLIFDQILPRLIAHEGQLVLHAAALEAPAGALLFVGPSGRGKSTLVASFRSESLNMLGDDAIILTKRDGSIECQATYPSLRLYPDSIAAVFQSPPVTVPVAQYTRKRSVQGLSRKESHRLPVVAIFVLDEPNTEQISVRPMRISEACMALVEQSFSLNPTDTACARQRLRLVSEAVGAITAYKLSYPRDYSCLATVRDRIFGALGGADNVTARQ